jgi:hypothetical protein
MIFPSEFVHGSTTWPFANTWKRAMHNIYNIAQFLIIAQYALYVEITKYA